MITGTQKATVIRAVIDGSSLSEAARKAGIKSAQANTALKGFCRRFRLPSEVADVRAEPARYLDVLKAFEASPEIALGRDLSERLTMLLQVKTPQEVTPKYVSNIEASQLLACGLTPINVHMIETWLASHGHGLKKAVPKDNKEIEEAKRCISWLHVHGFDVTAPRAQLEHLLSQLSPVPVGSIT